MGLERSRETRQTNQMACLANSQGTEARHIRQSTSAPTM